MIVTITLIDFGLVRQFRNPATYLHTQYTKKHSVVSTLSFTSINGQQGLVLGKFGLCLKPVGKMKVKMLSDCFENLNTCYGLPLSLVLSHVYCCLVSLLLLVPIA
jgi:hypothetical protein